ncbi:MAG: hypothetical protein IJC74_06565 [Clostridia bacterium]|nr:hypothetical protein [Clostridia bacterium]
MKKILGILVVLAMISGLIPSFGVAAAATESVVFYNAADNSLATELDNVKNVYADVSFVAEKSGSANVIAAQYNENDILIEAKILNSLSVSAGEQANVKTSAFSVDGAALVKVFVWNGVMPLLDVPGTIKKTETDNTLTVLKSGSVTAKVPNGVLLDCEVSELKLTITDLESSGSDVEAGENEALISLDVHIDGVSENNTTPIIITLPEVAEKGLNKGNISLYHVENGETVKMEEVATVEELTKHNQFTYNPLDGTVVLAMATFSEIAVLSDTENAWNGDVNYEWYDSSLNSFTIANADQLAGFGKIVGGMAEYIDQDEFKDKTVKLNADINLGYDGTENYINFYPIGYYYNGNQNDPYSTVYSFEGIFDGAGHTIANFYQNTWAIEGDYGDGYYKDGMGLFGYVLNGTVKNLTIDNFSSDGEFTPTGCVTAYSSNSTFENIAITNCNPRVYNTGNGGIVGIGGNDGDPEDYKLTFENITIDNTNKITALWGSWDVACGGLVGMFRGAGSAHMTNCHVAAQIDVFNDVCGNYQYYWYRYAGMLIGTNKTMTEDENGYTVPETSKYLATNCTVHFGEWNDYWYCELVDNSLASYTHDHQFSRLEKVDSVDVVNKTITVDGVTTAVPASGRANYVVVTGDASTENATCYHFKDGEVWNHEDAGTETVDGEEVLKEDKQHYHLPFNQLFTGYGWGVKHIPLGEFTGVTILDRTIADSVTKFEVVADAQYTHSTETPIKVGDLFKAVENLDEKVAIDTDNVQVFVSPASDDSYAGAVYTANETDWTQGTIEFTGSGEATVTITDYFYCKPTTINISVITPAINIIAYDDFANFNFANTKWYRYNSPITESQGCYSINNDSNNPALQITTTAAEPSEANPNASVPAFDRIAQYSTSSLGTMHNGNSKLVISARLASKGTDCWSYPCEVGLSVKGEQNTATDRFALFSLAHVKDTENKDIITGRFNKNTTDTNDNDITADKMAPDKWHKFTGIINIENGNAVSWTYYVDGTEYEGVYPENNAPNAKCDTIYFGTWALAEGTVSGLFDDISVYSLPSNAKIAISTASADSDGNIIVNFTEPVLPEVIQNYLRIDDQEVNINNITLLDNQSSIKITLGDTTTDSVSLKLLSGATGLAGKPSTSDNTITININK